MRDFRLNLGKIRDVIIYPFYECNLQCRHCFVSKPTGEIGFLNLPPTAFKKHIEQEHLKRLTEWNVKYYTLSGGEPFLSSVLPDMLTILRESNGKVVVYTNATLLVDKGIRELKPVLELIDHLTISLEGSQYWTEKIRGKVFDKCMKVLENVKEIIKPTIRMTYWYEDAEVVKNGRIMKINQLDDLLETVHFFNSNEIPVEVAPRMNYPPLKRELAMEFYDALSSFPLVDNLLPSYKNYFGMRLTCPAGWNRLCVDPWGNVLPCQWSNNVIAHVSWEDEWIEDAVNTWRRQRGLYMRECISCKIREVCQSSCRIAKDYKECPVKPILSVERYPNLRDYVEKKRKRDFIVVNNLKRLKEISPLVC